MEREQIVKLVTSLQDGSYIVEHEDGRLERRRDLTDWARTDTMTDEDIEAAAAADADWAPFQPIDWSKAEVTFPNRKQAISIRLDADVLDFFKAAGSGYQSRINAVLRSYVDQARGHRTGGGKARPKPPGQAAD